MRDHVRINDRGQFTLGESRWYCNSTVYFGRRPGTCQTQWMSDPYWAANQEELEPDFALMARLGFNHIALFINHKDVFDHGQLTRGIERLDEVIAKAKSYGLRVSPFIGRPFIDTPETFRDITGEEWKDGNRWLPAFNPRLEQAYIQQTLPLAERYGDEPAVLAYTGRIDRFHRGFDNITIPFNLKEEWAAWLKARYGTFRALLDAKGGSLEGDPKDFNEVLLPQESRWNASLKNPMAWDYVLMQKTVVGQAQARFNAAIAEAAPKQFTWTNFEGNSVSWAMLDAFNPEPGLLQAVWMEYYMFELTRPSYVQPFEEWSHTREICHRRIAHELPVIHNGAYLMARYLKCTTGVPVVINHGAHMDSRAHGVDSLEQQAANIDRVNAACLEADGDGWHYWCWSDDVQSWSTTINERRQNPTRFYYMGESCGLVDFHGRPRPVASVAYRYGRELKRRENNAQPVKTSDVLLLSSAPRMYNLFRRMAIPTATSVLGALQRLGVEPDVGWSACNDQRWTQEDLNRYRFIVIADNMYDRDVQDMPAKLQAFVEQGGTLYLPLGKTNGIEDEHGVWHENSNICKLSGVDPEGPQNWAGAGEPCANWPWPSDASQEPNADFNAFPRLPWGVTPEFQGLVSYSEKLALLGFRSTDDDYMTIVPGLVDSADVIAVGKFPSGSMPFVWRHALGKGTVYINAWTNNVFRDNESAQDHGGWAYDWMLDLPLQDSGAADIDLIKGSSMWLRNTWGYFPNQ